MGEEACLYLNVNMIDYIRQDICLPGEWMPDGGWVAARSSNTDWSVSWCSSTVAFRISKNLLVNTLSFKIYSPLVIITFRWRSWNGSSRVLLVLKIILLKFNQIVKIFIFLIRLLLSLSSNRSGFWLQNY